MSMDEYSGWAQSANIEATKGYPVPDWNAERQYEVYLPAGAKWYDYWTDTLFEGGKTIKANAPLAHSPLYIKAGTILPQGPDVQYAQEKKWDNLDITVYPGADATFTLYEDEGDNYNYEKGEYTEITMKWNNKSRTFTILPRKGAYKGMLNSRTFNVTLVSGASKILRYDGRKISVKL